jgi:hypothetical protein
VTPERAKYLLSHRLGWNTEFRYAYVHTNKAGHAMNTTVHEDGITPDEHEFIMKVWRGMPGWTSFYDAVCRIARGEV